MIRRAVVVGILGFAVALTLAPLRPAPARGAEGAGSPATASDGAGTSHGRQQDGEGEGEGEGDTGFFGTFRFEGEAVEGVEVRVLADGDEVGRAVSDETGRWEVRLPEPGEYEVVIVEESLPEGIALRDPDQRTIPADARPGRLQPAIFPLGEPPGGGPTDVDKFLNLLVEGVKLGSILALSSIGLSLVFSITGLVNFAHGELLTFGALIAWLFNASGAGPGVHLIGAAVIATVLGAAFGGLQDRLLWRPLRLRGAGQIAMLVIAIGLSLALRNVFLLFFGGGTRPYRDFAVQPVWTFGPVTLPPKDVVIIAVSLTLLVVLGVALVKTRIGTAVRAVSDDVDLAEASGIDVQRVVLTIWVVGAGLTALGGVFQGTTQAVSFDMGFRLLLLMFSAVILGGLGTAFGAMVGALIVGVLIQVSTLWLNVEFKEVVALGLLIVFLLFRPQGILGQRERVG